MQARKVTRTIRIDNATMRSLEVMAKAQNRTVNNMIETILKEEHERWRSSKALTDDVVHIPKQSGGDGFKTIYTTSDVPQGMATGLDEVRPPGVVFTLPLPPPPPHYRGLCPDDRHEDPDNSGLCIHCAGIMDPDTDDWATSPERCIGPRPTSTL